MATVPTTKKANLGPEDTLRKLKMVTALQARDMLTESAESFIKSGIRG